MDPQTATYLQFRTAHQPVWSCISELSRATDGLLLDVGCGPGVEVGAALEATRLRYIGLDSSFDAVRTACGFQGVTPAPVFISGDALALPFRARSIELVTFLFVIHQLAEPVAAIREAARVIRYGGTVAIVGIDSDDRNALTEFKIFPELREIEDRRHPAATRIAEICRDAGIASISRRVLYQSRTVDARLVAAIRSRYFSALRFLTDRRLREGSNELERLILVQGPVVEHCYCTVTVGRKSVEPEGGR